MSLLSPTHQTPAIHRFGHYLGTIAVNNNAKDNSNTAVPFTIPAGAVVLVCADAACSISSEFDSSSILTANSEPLAANEKRTGFLWTAETKLAVKAGAAANVQVFLLATRG